MPCRRPPKLPNVSPSVTHSHPSPLIHTRPYPVFPLFSKPTAASPSDTPFRWLASLGPDKTCLHGVHLSPKSSPKVACFDLDGCLIESSFGNAKSKGNKSQSSGSTALFKWWRPIVPAKLKEAHQSG